MGREKSIHVINIIPDSMLKFYHFSLWAGESDGGDPEGFYINNLWRNIGPIDGNGGSLLLNFNLVLPLNIW
jgi:hypothetical protein